VRLLPVQRRRVRRLPATRQQPVSQWRLASQPRRVNR